MAYPYATCDDAKWHELVDARSKLIDRIDSDHLNGDERHLAEIEDQLLNSWAPDFDALILKFELLFGQRLTDGDCEAEQICRMIGDIRRLTLSQNASQSVEGGAA